MLFELAVQEDCPDSTLVQVPFVTTLGAMACREINLLRRLHIRAVMANYFLEDRTVLSRSIQNRSGMMRTFRRLL